MVLATRIVYPAKPPSKKIIPPWILRVVMGVSLTSTIGVAFWFLINLPLLQIDRIAVRGTRLLAASVIETMVNHEITGSRWLFFPKNNFFLVSPRHIEAEIRHAFPAIAHLAVEKQFPHSLVVDIDERTPWGFYCQRFERTSAPERCWYLDERGIAYEELASVAGWLLPIIYASEAGQEGQETVAPDLLHFYDQAKSALLSLDGKLLSASVSTSTPDDVRLDLAEGWEVWVTRTRPVEEWRALLAALLTKEIQGSRMLLAYVDLRFGKKIFYKYR